MCTWCGHPTHPVGDCDQTIQTSLGKTPTRGPCPCAGPGKVG